MKNTLLIITLTFWSIIGISQNDKVLQQFSESYMHENKGDYTKALQAMKTIADEKSYEINLRTAYLFYMNGLYQESVISYEKAIQLRPLSIEARLGLVLPLSVQNNWDKIINVYKKILSIDSNHSTVNYRLGSIYYARKDYVNAHKYLEKLVNLYPFDYDGLLLFAWTELQLAKHKEAKLLFNKVLMRSPGDVSALEGLKNIK